MFYIYFKKFEHQIGKSQLQVTNIATELNHSVSCTRKAFYFKKLK